MSEKAIIIGAGPAGLTAAYELITRTNIKPVILEKSGDIGGISKTVNYKGNRIDIGGHRFFSKSDRVMDWWLQFMSLEQTGDETVTIQYRQKTRSLNNHAVTGKNGNPDNVMLVRNRLSRIFFLGKFFNYPLQLTFTTLRQLGFWRTVKIICSYVKAQLLPIKPESNLEQFFINKFGYQLYDLFFKDYTEKVWGVSCQSISAEWGAQRIKGVSLSKALSHAAGKVLQTKKKQASIAQKDTETSLIEKFLYPKFGPGQLWEEVARQICERGGEVHLHQDVKKFTAAGGRVTAIETINSQTGATQNWNGEYFFSTMPVQELVAGLGTVVPETVQQVAAGLQYRDFITVGLLLKKLSRRHKGSGKTENLLLKDTWVYIQEKGVKVGRLQLFNNWSPYMVKDPNTVWVGLEYFCNKADDFWQQDDSAIQQKAIEELAAIGLAQKEDVLDAVVLRMEKTYPAYFGTYDRFDVIREFIDRHKNLYLIGRNGMHKYNNSDHSMLTAMVAVDNICNGVTDKSNIWAINTEQEYQEEKLR